MWHRRLVYTGDNGGWISPQGWAGLRRRKTGAGIDVRQQQTPRQEP